MNVGTGLDGITMWHICDGSRPRADRLLIRTTGGPGRCRQTGADMSTEGHAETAGSLQGHTAVAGTEPGALPSRSTATTLTDRDCCIGRSHLSGGAVRHREAGER